MNSKRQKLIQEVLESIAILRGSLQRGHSPMFRHHGFGMPHFKLMMDMAASDDGVSVNELSKHLDITPAAVTQFVDKLVRKGLVERVGDPNDRRIVKIRLTDDAQRKFGAIKKVYYDKTAVLFKNLSDKELGQLSVILKKIDTESADFSKNDFRKKWREIKNDTK